MNDRFLNLRKNDPRRAGTLASEKRKIGKNDRYVVAAVHTRFDDVEWFVWDSFGKDYDGFPLVIRQSVSYDEATMGLK